MDISGLLPLLVSPSSYYFVAREVRVTGFGTFKSPDSKPLNFRDPMLLSAPTIAPTPLFECSRATGVYGHQPADRITVRDFASGATRFVVPRAYGTYDYVGEFAPKLMAGESLFAVYETCDGLSLSPRSAVEKVVPFPGRQLPRPRVARASAAAGVTSFEVKEITNGATLHAELTRPGKPVAVVEQSCIGGGQGCRVYVPAGWNEFQHGDQLSVAQELCPDSRSRPHMWSITACYSESPTFAVLPKNGDEVISLSEFARGSWLMAYVCIQTIGGSCTTWSPLGSAFDSGTINLSRALVAGDFVAVSQQVTTACPALNGTATTVR